MDESEPRMLEEFEKESNYINIKFKENSLA